MNPHRIDICKIHGKTKFSYNKYNYRRCLKCMTASVTNRRRKVKVMAVDFLGGKCLHCGYNKCVSALEFHHKDPKKKDFSLSRAGVTRSWEKVKKEIKKCILLCSNCHREIHYKLYK